MKRIIVLSMITAMLINLENGMATTLTPVTAQIRPAIKNAQARGAKPKAKLKSRLAVIPYNNEEVIVDDDIVLARNRNKIEVIHEEEEELSDYVKIRLLVARAKAMKAYHNKYA